MFSHPSSEYRSEERRGWENFSPGCRWGTEHLAGQGPARASPRHWDKLLCLLVLNHEFFFFFFFHCKMSKLQPDKVQDDYEEEWLRLGRCPTVFSRAGLPGLSAQAQSVHCQAARARSSLSPGEEPAALLHRSHLLLQSPGLGAHTALPPLGIDSDRLHVSSPKGKLETSPCPSAPQGPRTSQGPCHLGRAA